MAKRLATDYVKACLHLTEADIVTLNERFIEHEILPMEKVMENGVLEWVLTDVKTGEDVSLKLHRESGTYVISESFRITSLKLANLFRKMIICTKGDAVVHRIYEGFTMVYTYMCGSVAKIEEMTDKSQKTVFEAEQSLDMMLQLYQRTDVEDEIKRIRYEINLLLDQRLQTDDPMIRNHIDIRLAPLSHKLFLLEA